MLNIATRSFGVCVINWLLPAVLFIRYSVNYIDNKLDRRGAGRPEWDGIGIRVGVYAMAILSKWFARTAMVPGPDIRDIARRSDYYLALRFQLSLIVAAVSAAGEFCAKQFKRYKTSAHLWWISIADCRKERCSVGR